MSLSRAIKFREHILRDLRTPNCMLVSSQNSEYALEVEERIKNAFAFYIDPEGVSFLEDSIRKLSEADFFHAIANIRLPFTSVWLELDATTSDGKHSGRVGAMVDCTDTGLRVFQAQLFKLPEEPSPTILYSGSEVTFARDGSVELADTPAAFFQDALTEIEKGHLKQGMRPRDSIQPDTVREREAEALRRSIQCTAILLAISSFHNRSELLDIEQPDRPSKRIIKQYEQRKEKAPAYGLSIIRLGKDGRSQAATQSAEIASEGAQRRAAHWVRGHLFLARNGKITWRKAHVRGEGLPAMKPRRVTTHSG